MYHQFNEGILCFLTGLLFGALNNKLQDLYVLQFSAKLQLSLYPWLRDTVGSHALDMNLRPSRSFCRTSTCLCTPLPALTLQNMPGFYIPPPPNYIVIQTKERPCQSQSIRQRDGVTRKNQVFSNCGFLHLLQVINCMNSLKNLLYYFYFK